MSFNDFLIYGFNFGKHKDLTKKSRLFRSSIKNLKFYSLYDLSSTSYDANKIFITYIKFIRDSFTHSRTS